MPVTTNMPVSNPPQIHYGSSPNFFAPHMMAERQPNPFIPSVQFRHQENFFFMPVVPPQFYPVFHQVLPHHLYTPHTMMEMRQQSFIQSIQNSAAGRITNDNSQMNAGGYYSAPQPLRHDLPLLAKRQGKPIRIQDPDDGGQDVTLDELRRGRSVSFGTRSPQPEAQPPVQSVDALSEAPFPTARAAKIVVRREIVEEDEKKKEKQTEEVMEQNKQVAPSALKASKRPTWAEILRGQKRMEYAQKIREEKTQTEKPDVQKKQDRQQLSENTKKSTLSKRAELYIWNLDYSVDNDRLYKAFLPFGNIIHAKVMMEDGRSRGFGYVSFSSTAEAEAAIKEMNGKMLGRRALNVSLSKAREDRQPYLTQGKQMSSRQSGKPRQSPQKEI